MRVDMREGEMTVKELIEELQKLPPDWLVIIQESDDIAVIPSGPDDKMGRGHDGPWVFIG